jgi:hypothetical protein
MEARAWQKIIFTILMMRLVLNILRIQEQDLIHHTMILSPPIHIRQIR